MNITNTHDVQLYHSHYEKKISALPQIQKHSVSPRVLSVWAGSYFGSAPWSTYAFLGNDMYFFDSSPTHLQVKLPLCFHHIHCDPTEDLFKLLVHVTCGLVIPVENLLYKRATALNWKLTWSLENIEVFNCESWCMILHFAVIRYAWKTQVTLIQNKSLWSDYCHLWTSKLKYFCRIV